MSWLEEGDDSLEERSPRLKKKDMVFTCPCEWDTCDEVFSELQSATKHLSEHIYSYLKSRIQGDGPTKTEWSFRCQWRECGAEVEGTITDFNRHAYFHLFHTRLKCQGQTLMTQRRLQPCLLDPQSHNWIPELPENLQCGWVSCQMIYDNPLLFYQHVNSHCDEYARGNQTLSTCKWTGCQQTFKSKHKLREHLRSHSQEKVCACPTCGGLFASCTKMVDHLRRQADTEYQMYLCAHCNKKFATERLLRDHMRHHVNHYKCPLCDMTCSTPANLRLHIKYRHSNEKPFRCGHCPHSSKSASDLRKHLESHSEEENFACHFPDCPYRTRTYSSLANHFRRIHQEEDVSKYQCHVCQHTFTRGSSLTFHLKVKHKFKWPSGHSRFRYKQEKDGYYRLQTIRYESLETRQQFAPQQQQQQREERMELAEEEEEEEEESSREGEAGEHGSRLVSMQGVLLEVGGGLEAGEGVQLELPEEGGAWQLVYQEEEEGNPAPLGGPGAQAPSPSSSDSHTYNLQMLGSVALAWGP